MPHDPARVAECKAWLDRASADLDSAPIMLAASRPDTALFHCQQAVEKAWRAFLVWHDVPFRRTHNLRQLGQACVALGGTLGELAEKTEDLTQFAWVFHHPGELESPSLQEAQAASSIAREVCAGLLSRLPEEVRL